MALIRLALALLSVSFLCLVGASAAAASGVCRPDPPCVERCVEQARGSQAACLDSGGSSDDCFARMIAQRSLCLVEECVPGPSCRERCTYRSRGLYWRCLRSGRPSGVCFDHFLSSLQMCVNEYCRPCVCPEIYAPVCGADGMTYPNSCESRCAGVEIKYEGECRPGRCRSNEQCPAKQICYPPTGMCQPECAVSCLVPDPVCGTDGVTYVCGPEDAWCHGAEVAFEGECKPRCRSNEDCPRDLICYPPTDTCRPACQIACFRYDPVCGTDGVTYACGAQDAWCHGVEVDQVGECPDN